MKKTLLPLVILFCATSSLLCMEKPPAEAVCSSSSISASRSEATATQAKEERGLATVLRFDTLDKVEQAIRKIPQNDVVAVLADGPKFERPVIAQAAYNHDARVLPFLLGLFTPEKRLELLRGKYIHATECTSRTTGILAPAVQLLSLLGIHLKIEDTESHKHSLELDEEQSCRERFNEIDECMLWPAIRFNPNPRVIQFLFDQIPQNELIPLLLETDLLNNTLLLNALENNSLQITRMLWDRMPPLKRTEQLFFVQKVSDNTALHRAMHTRAIEIDNMLLEYDHAEAVRFVLSNIPQERRDEALNKPNKHGETPLHVAAKLSLRPAIRELILWGANPDLKNKRGQAAYEILGEWVKWQGEKDLAETREVFKKALAERQELLARQTSHHISAAAIPAAAPTASASFASTAPHMAGSASASMSAASCAAAASGWSEPMELDTHPVPAQPTQPASSLAPALIFGQPQPPAAQPPAPALGQPQLGLAQPIPRRPSSQRPPPILIAETGYTPSLEPIPEDLSPAPAQPQPHAPAERKAAPQPPSLAPAPAPGQQQAALWQSERTIPVPVMALAGMFAWWANGGRSGAPR